MTNWVIGVDGGQTSTKCVLATTEGEIKSRGEGGPLIHLAAEGGRGRFTRSLRETLADAWRRANLAPGEVAAIGLGLTGVEANTVEAKVVVELVPAAVQAVQVEVQSDAIAALMGAHLGKPGVIVIAGTGSIALGVNARGEHVRAGGWGWLIGDEGSATAIGRSGLLAASNAFDGAGPSTQLLDLFTTHLQLAVLTDVKRIVQGSEFGQRGLAALAPLVGQAAEQGDAPAARIIAEAGHALARQAAAVIRRLNFAEPARVAPVGGAFDHVAGLRDSFGMALAKEPAPAIVVSPELPPVLGAVIMALSKCVSELEPAVERLRVEFQNQSSPLSPLQRRGRGDHSQ